MNTLRVIKFFNSMCFWIFIRENLLLLQWERDYYLFGKTEVSMVPYITEQLSDSTMRRHWASGSPAQHLALKATFTRLRVTLFVRMDALAQTQFPPICPLSLFVTNGSNQAAAQSKYKMMFSYNTVTNGGIISCSAVFFSIKLTVCLLNSGPYNRLLWFESCTTNTDVM